MVAKICDYDFEDYDLQKMKYNYVENGVVSSNDRARQYPPWPRILSFLAQGYPAGGRKTDLFYFTKIYLSEEC